MKRRLSLSIPPLALLCLLAAAGRTTAPPARDRVHAFDIAITLDDLPWVGALGPEDSRPAAMARVLAALERHHVPATGFVVCGRASDGRALLRKWLAAGHELGNHSVTHPHLDALTLEAWEREVCDCRDSLAVFTGSATRWFRYPFLQMARTAGKRDSARAIVHSCGHEIAHVSVDTGEWALVKPYVAALEDGDRARAAAIGRAYVEHLRAAIRHYRDVAAQRVGHDIDHVLLLHANALAADHLDTLLAAIEEDGGRFVPLAQALADPVYQRPDDYAGPIGLSWLYRFAPAADSAWVWDNEQVQMMEERFPSE
ncbi:MAG: polysaccharide deacetylase family protein [Candidatus Eisenbacteria bacterium]